jgi:hypothetical protein
VTHLAIRPLRRTLQFLYVSGRNMDAWLPLIDLIERWAAMQGATKAEVVGRKGWMRVLRRQGYRETHRIGTKELSGAERNE